MEEAKKSDSFAEIFQGVYVVIEELENGMGHKSGLSKMIPALNSG